MNREDLIAAMKATALPKPVAVEVKGWGTLHVLPLTVAEVEEASAQAEPSDGKKRTYARGAARIICDAKGKRLFDPMNTADVELLASQQWSVIQKLMAAADAKGTDPEGN